MTYIDYINQLLKKQLQAVGDPLTKEVFLYGQNVNAGSCLGGLTKGLGGKNVQNSENSLIGFGFGMMLAGGHAIYAMKQFDFLFLGTDHLMNTWNMMKQMDYMGSFTILCTIVDSNKEGPQSCAQNFEEFCKALDIDYGVISNKQDADLLTGRILDKGFRIIALKQSLYNTEV